MVPYFQTYRMTTLLLPFEEWTHYGHASWRSNGVYSLNKFMRIVGMSEVQNVLVLHMKNYVILLWPQENSYAITSNYIIYRFFISEKNPILLWSFKKLKKLWLQHRGLFGVAFLTISITIEMIPLYEHDVRSLSGTCLYKWNFHTF